MNIFTSSGILLISGLIVASLKLIPGIFAYFYHYASGKYSAKKVSDLTIFFILGAETLPAIIFTTLNFILCIFTFTNFSFSSNIFTMTAVGALFALAIAFFLFYFRKGAGTKLFISRKTASELEKKSRTIKTRSDAFVLGFISGLPELIFTLPLYLILLIEISKSFILTASCSALLLFFILLIISPLFFLYAYFKNGNNLANLERLRVKNKKFFRFFIPLLYILIALLLIIFRILP